MKLAIYDLVPSGEVTWDDGRKTTKYSQKPKEFFNRWRMDWNARLGIDFKSMKHTEILRLMHSDLEMFGARWVHEKNENNVTQEYFEFVSKQACCEFLLKYA